MSRQIDELTDVMRLRAGQEIELHREPMDLVALVRQTIEAHDPSTERHTIRLESSVDELVGVWDGPRLERVLDNLLGNAIKYSPNGGEIIVRVGRRGEERRNRPFSASKTLEWAFRPAISLSSLRAFVAVRTS